MSANGSLPHSEQIQDHIDQRLTNPTEDTALEPSRLGTIFRAGLIEPRTSSGSRTNLDTSILSSGVQRKRTRSDSESQDTPEPSLSCARPPVKMYKSYDDAEMEGLVVEGFAVSSASGSPTRVQARKRSTSDASWSTSSNGKGKAVEIPPLVAIETPPVCIEKSLNQAWKRDEQFYLEDGSCVFLVEDTLFNVRMHLNRRLCCA